MPRISRQPAPRLPLWHPSKYTWVNGLGFSLSVFLALWLLGSLASSLMGDAEAFEFSIPAPFIMASLLTMLVTVGLCATLIFGIAWKGADFGSHRARNLVFFWSLAGLLFFTVQLLVLIKFGSPSLPNVAEWASDLYWGIAPIGILCFALMTYVNYAAAHDPHFDEWHEHDEEHDEVHDDEHDEEHEYDEHEEHLDD